MKANLGFTGSFESVSGDPKPEETFSDQSKPPQDLKAEQNLSEVVHKEVEFGSENEITDLKEETFGNLDEVTPEIASQEILYVDATTTMSETTLDRNDAEIESGRTESAISESLENIAALSESLQPTPLQDSTETVTPATGGEVPSPAQPVVDSASDANGSALSQTTEGDEPNTEKSTTVIIVDKAESVESVTEAKEVKSPAADIYDMTESILETEENVPPSAVSSDKNESVATFEGDISSSAVLINKDESVAEIEDHIPSDKKETVADMEDVSSSVVVSDKIEYVADIDGDISSSVIVSDKNESVVDIEGDISTTAIVSDRTESVTDIDGDISSSVIVSDKNKSVAEVEGTAATVVVPENVAVTEPLIDIISADISNTTLSEESISGAINSIVEQPDSLSIDESTFEANRSAISVVPTGNADGNANESVSAIAELNESLSVPGSNDRQGVVEPENNGSHQQSAVVAERGTQGRSPTLEVSDKSIDSSNSTVASSESIKAAESSPAISAAEAAKIRLAGPLMKMVGKLSIY